MLRAGLADAGLEPSAVQYAEAHGTGTPVGDPIEAAALGAVLRRPNGDAACPIGSVKTNIGHLEAAAGAAGLIKSALALHHGEIPPSLNFEEPSPDIDFDALALRVVTELEPWPSNGAVPARNDQLLRLRRRERERSAPGGARPRGRRRHLRRPDRPVPAAGLRP